MGAYMGLIQYTGDTIEVSTRKLDRPRVDVSIDLRDSLTERHQGMSLSFHSIEEAIACAESFLAKVKALLPKEDNGGTGKPELAAVQIPGPADSDRNESVGADQAR